VEIKDRYLMIKDIVEAKNTLIPIIKQGKLVVFAGSGVSADADVPLWNQLIQNFIEFCKDLQQYLDPEDRFIELILDCESQKKEFPTRIASVLREKLDVLEKEKSYKLIVLYKKWLEDTFIKDDPHQNHDYIVGTNYAQILTTNYDNLFENAAAKLGYYKLLMRSYTQNDVEKVAKVIYQKEPSIIHVHGGIEDIKFDEIVFTAEDYIRIEREYPGFTLVLQSLFLNYSIMFVGYGGKDPHFERFVDEMSYCLNYSTNENLPRIFSVDVIDNMNKMKIAYDKKRRIELIALNNFTDITELLGELQAAAPRKRE
jgi:hypothetical protein